MKHSSGYQLADEPKPSALASIAVDPLWPFLAIMFGGLWLSWTWFVVNAFAVGSPTRRRELVIAVVGVFGAAGLLALLFALVEADVMPIAGIPYAILVLVVWKIGVTYWLHVLQSRTFEIYRYYGGVVRNALPVLFVAFLVSGRVLTQIREWNTFLGILLS